jgi:hypothetical protein
VTAAPFEELVPLLLAHGDIAAARATSGLLEPPIADRLGEVARESA